MRLGQQASIVIRRDKQGQAIAHDAATGRHASGATARDALRRLGTITEGATWPGGTTAQS